MTTSFRNIVGCLGCMVSCGACSAAVELDESLILAFVALGGVVGATFPSAGMFGLIAAVTIIASAAIGRKVTNEVAVLSTISMVAFGVFHKHHDENPGTRSDSLKAKVTRYIFPSFFVLSLVTILSASCWNLFTASLWILALVATLTVSGISISSYLIDQ
jgi:hypothetical protein